MLDAETKARIDSARDILVGKVPDPKSQVEQITIALIYKFMDDMDRWDERYDVIMANPPFMSPKGGIRPHNRFSIKAKRSEVLFVDYIAEHLQVNGRAGVIVPEGIIFQGQKAYKALRKLLLESYLWCVVSLPPGVFNGIPRFDKHMIRGESPS